MRNGNSSSGSRAGCRRTLVLGLAGGLLTFLCSSGVALAQTPAPGGEMGCCCITVSGGKVGCGQKTQEACLAEQPKAPGYDRLPDWARAVAASTAQERERIKTGWRAGPCAP